MATVMENLASLELYKAGQGPWLDTLSRKLIRSGTLKAYIEDKGLLGVTSNPSIFQQAISQGAEYESDIRRMLKKGATTLEIYDALTVSDIQETCDLFLPVFRETKGDHGFVSLEVLPCLAALEEPTIQEAQRLFKLVNRPNLMIKVPATSQGVSAVQKLIAEGININVTLIFSRQNYKEVAQAYLTGLETFAAKGGDLSKVHSVASVFVSRIDTDIDKQLELKLQAEKNTNKRAALEELKGKAAVANSKLIYQDFKDIFGAAQFQFLSAKGANVQKVLWGSTSTKNPAYPDLLYVEPLVGRNTVNTLPQATWEALLDHGNVQPDTVEEDIEDAKYHVERLLQVGIRVDEVCQRLQKEGVRAFVASFESLMATLEKKQEEFLSEAKPVKCSFHLSNEIQEKVKETVKKLEQKELHKRWLAKDPTLWTSDREHHKVILNRLGWVDICEKISGRLYEVDLLTAKILKDKIRNVVLLGMGGSSLAAEVMSIVLRSPACRTQGGLKNMKFYLLDTTDPLSISKVEKEISFKNTVFVVGSKSGSTIETRSQYQYFFHQMKTFYKGCEEKAAQHFVIVTDFGSPLAALGQSKNFRGLFLNPVDIGGRYSALSFFGMVPAALLGIDIRRILKDARRFLSGMRQMTAVSKNEGLSLGILLGVLAQKGKDKLTFWTSPELSCFADWVEQLVAESTGKEGKGITPVVGEEILDLSRYGKDRVFVVLRLKGENEQRWALRIQSLKRAGFSVLDFVWDHGMNVGGEFLRWEVATSLAGVVLRINPFDEPNVKESKDITGQLLEDVKKKIKLKTPSPLLKACGQKLTPQEFRILSNFFSKVPPKGFVALLAYVDRYAGSKKALQAAQGLIADQLKVPALSGFGPRYLHSIGQLYKGGPKQGVFIEFFVRDRKDLKIPGEIYGFSQLKQAQALGDYKALTAKKLPVLAVDLGKDLLGGLEAFSRKLEMFFRQQKARK